MSQPTYLVTFFGEPKLSFGAEIIVFFKKKIQIFSTNEILQLKNKEKLNYWVGLGQDLTDFSEKRKNLADFRWYTCMIIAIFAQYELCLKYVSKAVELK